MYLNLNRHVLLLAACAALTQLIGCASIVSGSNQSVSVETRADSGQNVAGASCKLTNNKGSWFVTTPGSTIVNRSYEDLAVRCEKESHEPGFVAAKSSTKGMAFGNIIFGGVIGAGVDISTGAAYDYPTLITVTMGKGSSVEPSGQQAPSTLPVAQPAAPIRQFGNPGSPGCSHGAMPC